MNRTAHAIWVLYRRSLRELVSLGPQTLLAPLLVPSFMLFIFSGLYSAVFERLGLVIIGTPGFQGATGYVQYVIAAPLVMAAFWGTSSAGIGVAVERQLGFYDRMELSPLGPRISQIGRRLADGTRIAFSITFLALVGFAAGADIPNWFIALGITIPLAAALGMAYGGIAFSLCLRTGSAESTQAVTPLFFPFLFTSTAFIPLPLIPGWLGTIARYNPLSPVCEAIRLSFAGRIDGDAVLRSVVVIAVLASFSQLLIVMAERKVRSR